MAVDYRGVVEAAVNAAFNENHADAPGPRKQHGSGVKAVAAGAALATVARVVVRKAPDRVRMPSIGDLTERLRERLESRWPYDDDDEDDFIVEDVPSSAHVRS